MNALLNWLDDRTGIRGLMHEALYERIPGGARWRYVWGSTLVFAFFVQVVTGICLWMAYSPGGQTAWESVYYIQYEMQGGWLLRGLHHFMAQAMVILLALHLMQVVIDGAYRAPREVNFWMGLILMQIVLALSLTGYLLPWDQKGFWATRVATNLAGIVPYVGPQLQKVVVGGSDYGHFTLTRFFALHAGVLPGLLIFFLVLHVAMFRKHGIKARATAGRADAYFWPDQILKDAVACLAVLAVVLFFIFRPALFGESIGDRPGDVLGAELGAPADRANEYSAARPEWYFLFLFQFLKLFEWAGDWGELLGAIIIPGAIMFVLFLMPLVGRWKLGHGFNVAFLFALMIGIAVLTGQAMYDDRMAEWVAEPKDKGSPAGHKYALSKQYLAAVADAEVQAERALVLARAPSGISTGGVLDLVRNDPKLQGPRLFERYCKSCHSHTDAQQLGIASDAPSAPNLSGIGSRAWIAGVLDPAKIDGPEYFGNTAHKEGDMIGYVKDTLSEPDDEMKQKIEKVVAALSAEAGLPAQAQQDAADVGMIAEGREILANEIGCTDCHKFGDIGELGYAPDLTGYGSREWLIGMISDPNHERFYPEINDRMPAFAADPDDAAGNMLSQKQLGLMVDWLRGDWYELESKDAAKAKDASNTTSIATAP